MWNRRTAGVERATSDDDLDVPVAVFGHDLYETHNREKERENETKSEDWDGKQGGCRGRGKGSRAAGRAEDAASVAMRRTSNRFPVRGNSCLHVHDDLARYIAKQQNTLALQRNIQYYSYGYNML